MQHLEQPDFLDNLAEDEKLIGLMAYNRGLQHSLTHLLQRLDSFYALLELELEDSPAGSTYHEQGALPLARAVALLGASDGIATDSQDFETFDLQILLRGMAQRIGKVGLAQIDLALEDDAPDMLVSGNLVLLQQMLFALPYLFGANPDVLPASLSISVEPRTIDDDFLAAHPAAMSAGPCYAITVRTEAASDAGPVVPLVERLGAAGELPLSQRLVLCLGVALYHGGDLLTSRDGDELESLTWLLPQYTDSSPGYSGDADADLQGTGTILLVDDEDIIWDVVIDMLQDAGYTVILAANGRDCVEIYQENPGEIDLVLLDMVMPEMNGHQAFFALKEIDPDVKVLLHSGYVAEEDAREVLDAGAAGFLQKPYRMSTLAGKIRDILTNCEG